MGQHYLPKCYLNEFCGINHQLFSINSSAFKFGKIPAPQIKRPVEVCHESDFYSINFDKFLLSGQLGSAEKLAVEKSFHWYENAYPKVLKKIKSRGRLTYEEAYSLAYALFDFKLRNKFWRDNAIEAKKAVLIYDTYSKIEKNNEILERFNVSEEQAISTINKVKDRMFNDENFSKQLHLNRFLKTTTSEQSTQDKIVKSLLSSIWQLSFSSKGEFITSDNPGFCVDHKENLHNTRFASEFIFMVPLSPHFYLFIDDQYIDTEFLNNPATKTLYYRNINPESINLINKGLIFNINKYLFGNTKEVLMKIIPELQKRYG